MTMSPRTAPVRKVPVSARERTGAWRAPGWRTLGGAPVRRWLGPAIGRTIADAPKPGDGAIERTRASTARLVRMVW